MYFRILRLLPGCGAFIKIVKYNANSLHGKMANGYNTLILKFPVKEFNAKNSCRFEDNIKIVAKISNYH